MTSSVTISQAGADSKDLNVAIVGGGLCGLACAIGLRKAGVNVQIYEAARQFGEVGAGVGVGPNALRVLKDLGVLEDVLAKSGEPDLNMRSFLFVKGVGDHEEIYDYPHEPYDNGLGIHRASLLEALVKHIDPSQAHFGKRLTYLTSSSSSPHDPPLMQLHFADGTTAEADVVLGADGVRSCTRSYVLGLEQTPNDGAPEPDLEKNPNRSYPNVVFSNTNAFRGLVPLKKLEELGMTLDKALKGPVCWCGPGKHLITFPIRGNTIFNVVAFARDRTIPMGAHPLSSGQSWVTPRTKDELLATYEGWGPDVQTMLGCIENPSVWSIHIVNPPLECFWRDSVALLGDAAHAMLPHHGAGAGQALEDALMLAKLLGHSQATKPNIQSILKAYDATRRPRANMVLSSSTRIGEVYEEHGPSGPEPAGIRRDLVGCWDEIWHHDFDVDYRAAVRMLVEEGVFSEE